MGTRNCASRTPERAVGSICESAGGQRGRASGLFPFGRPPNTFGTFEWEFGARVWCSDLGGCPPDDRLRLQHQTPPLHHRTRNTAFFPALGVTSRPPASSLSGPGRPLYPTRRPPARYTTRHRPNPSPLSRKPTSSDAARARANPKHPDAHEPEAAWLGSEPH